METEVAKERDKLFDKPELMTVAEVTEFLRVHRRSLDRYVKQGLLRKVKYGGAVRYEKEEVRKLAGLKG